MPGTLSRVAWLSVVFAAVRSARVEVKPPMDSSTEQKASSSPSFSYKRLNGPPADFEAMALPVATASVSASTSTTTAVTLAESDGGMTWSRQMYVDSAEGFAFALFITDASATVELKDADGSDIALDAHRSAASAPVGDDPSRAVRGVQWTFQGKSSPGLRTVIVTSTDTATVLGARAKRAVRKPDADKVDGYMVWWTNSDVYLMGHTVNSDGALVGHMVGATGKLIDGAQHAWADVVSNRTAGTPSPATGVVTSAKLVAILPDGTTQSVEMTDDGLGLDSAADDGEYTGAFKGTIEGRYTLYTIFRGTDADGAPFERSLEKSMTVAAESIRLGHAVGTVTQPGRLQLLLSAEVESAASWHTTYRPYFEVWGVDGQGKPVAVGYASGLADLKKHIIGPAYFELELDLQWAAKAGAKSPYTLKNLYIQDTDLLNTVAEVAEMPVSVFSGDAEVGAGLQGANASFSRGSTTASFSRGSSPELLAAETAAAARFTGEVTTAMREGIPPPRAEGGVTGAVMVIHGFCADKNPFEQQASDWTNPVFYSAVREGDKISNSNDVFAKNVIAFAERQNLAGFSAVGQSQGGMVAVHILNYYHTGLDATTTGRIVQSIATPFLGNSALSTLGGIVDAIGGDCDGPYDLTRTGAEEWIAGITPETIAKMNVYTTKYAKGGFFGGGFCNSLMNLFLDGENDGVTEIVYSLPEGAAFHGTVAGQCHTEGMEWPAAFFDSDRNKEMSAAAARS